MDIKTITATLALLGSGVTLGCDAAEKPTKEVEGAKTDKAKDSAKEGAKAKTVDGDEADKAKAQAKGGEMSCGAGACGAKMGDKPKPDGDKPADGDKPEAAGDKPAADAPEAAHAKGDAKAAKGEASCGGEGACGAKTDKAGKKAEDKS